VTHAFLVQLAARWLASTRKCSLVLTEFQCANIASETPDAIGWLWGWSVLVECKVSRADFRADAAKHSRSNREHSIGQERWYLTPPGLVGAHEVPPGWGLLESGAKVRTIVRCPAGPGPGERSPRGLIDHRIQANELPFLLSVYRRKHCSECGCEMFAARHATKVADAAEVHL
jgi:hypothetical protein